LIFQTMPDGTSGGHASTGGGAPAAPSPTHGREESPGLGSSSRTYPTISVPAFTPRALPCMPSGTVRACALDASQAEGQVPGNPKVVIVEL
jgi:hypothetical protein